MNRIEEIDSRFAAIKEELNNLEDVEEIRKLNEEVDSLTEEKKELVAKEERAKVAEQLEKRELEAEKVKIEKEEEKKMEKKFDLSSKEYRNAWAKKMMNLPEERFTEDELRALGDAITTTATEFVASAADAQGINNGGLFIPTSVRMDLMELISQDSPFFRDVRKLAVDGNVDLPYLFAADDSNWVTETSATVNEGQEYKNLKLTGFELAKDIVITWKLEEMAVDSFIEFILDELNEKMGKAIVKAVLYGNGSNQPTGVTHGLTPVTTGTNAIERVLNTYKSLSKDARVGAKVYISTDVNLDIVSYKDQNGNYPFLAGIPAVSGFKIEVDPYLQDDDIVAGNPRYYIFNEVSPVRVDKESSIKGRKVTYGSYGIYDGKAKPGYFALGQKEASE